MNRLTSQQRKLIYAVAFVVMFLPISMLGMPATSDADSGGHLAQLRHEYDLGESTLGDVDPASATMNLVLLGLRGVAVNALWMEHEEQKQTKNWAEMRATTESIITLQPHYLQVWRYHGWDLAYNVSAKWDNVEDRYYWVKEGAKFTMRGSDRNRRYPELYWDVGHILGHKIGRADEWRYYRQYVRQDPDYERFEGGPDPDINPEGKDNYHVAYDWFKKANEAEERQEQHIMMRALFRSHPARSRLAYAEALQREGKFGEITSYAWQEGWRAWTEDYGREYFQTPGGELYMEAFSNDDIQSMARRNETDEETIRHWLDRTWKVTNYKYWRTRALAESQADTVAAHRALHEGEQLFKVGQLEEAQKELSKGMELFDKMLQDYPELKDEDLTIEEALWGILLWKNIHELRGEDVPDEYPLDWLWDKQRGRIPNLEDKFNRQFGGV